MSLQLTIPDPPAPGLIRIVLIGDTVGKPGLNIVYLAVPLLKERVGANLVIVNAENAADGAGLREREYRKLVEAGVDAVTLGDHIYKKKEIIATLQSESNIVRPANFPAAAPGKTWCTVNTDQGIPVVVASVLGRVFMRPVDCPFAALERVLSEVPNDVPVRVLDIHAKQPATSKRLADISMVDGPPCLVPIPM